MERLRRARRRSVACNRETRRKVDKDSKRRQRIKNQVFALLQNCPASIIADEELTSEQVIVIKDLYAQLVNQEIDYYPIPKRIHNTIRRYAHNNKRGRKESLLDFISNTVIAKWSQRWNNQDFEVLVQRITELERRSLSSLTSPYLISTLRDVDIPTGS